jgi:DNA-binding XRE family transcriptional regulator
MSSQALSGPEADSRRNDALLKARFRAGLTQKELAVRVGMSRQAIVALEREGGRPHAPNARKIAAELGVDMFDLWPLEEAA